MLALIHSGPVDCQLWGRNVRLFPDRNVSERKALMRPDWLDRTEYAVLRRRMSPPKSVLIDVGANAGLYSLFAALHAGHGSRIVAIEPNAEVLARLEFNLDLVRHDMDPSIDVVTVCAAVGDRDGEALLSTGPDEGSRTLLADSGRPVKLRRLAPLLEELGLGEVSILKIDVEGYEDRVLPPYLAEVAKSRWPLSIIIERAHRDDWAVDCIADCLDRGYRLAATTNNNVILERPN